MIKMDWEDVKVVLLSKPAVLMYEIIVLVILLGLVIYVLRTRKKRKKEIVNYRESERKNSLNKALTNEKRGGNL
ncbi:MAG: FeoB-associated Cys-rich membrane protein [Lachnospiraceae bacterium]|nr:FeoB-associated Cys-rich membrane protein [Lachnospiraceae bacterium]